MSKKSMGEFVNSAGHAFAITGISPLAFRYVEETLRREWKETGKLPAPPTYTATNVAGETVRIPHDATTEKTPEEQAAWDAYVTAQRELDAAISERILNLVLLDCVLENVEQMRAWESKMKALGLPVPEDPAEKKLAFGRMEIIRLPEDVGDLTIAVMRLTPGVEEEAVKAAERQFRRAIQEATAGESNK